MPETNNLSNNSDNIIRPLKSENMRIILCAGIILAIGLSRPFLRSYDMVTATGQSSLVVFVYIGVIAQWLVSIRRRFVQKDVRIYLIISALLMIFLLTERFVKYEFVYADLWFTRMLWYSYYIPFVMIPVLLFMSSLYIGKTDQYRIDRRWKLIFIPPVIVIAGIMTNDLHQQAFRFNPGMVNWTSDYTRGILYYLAIAILVVSLLGMMIVVLQNGLKKNVMKHMWLLFVVILLGVVYALSYIPSPIYDEKLFIQKMYEIPEFACIFLMAFFESLVFTHLIPTNSGHEAFFMVSSLKAGLTDNEYNVKLKAEEWKAPEKPIVKRAEKWPIYLADEKTMLRCYPVSGGHFYWLEDVEEIIRVNEKLAETGDYLEEERLMLDASVKLEESRRSMEEQNRLYDMVSMKLQPHLGRISDILNDLPDDEEEFRKQMRYAGVLGAYIKRRSNLLLLSGSYETIDSEELKISVEELLSYVNLTGVDCLADIEKGISLTSDQILGIFELTETVIESSLHYMKALLVTFRENNGVKILYIEIAGIGRQKDTGNADSEEADIKNIDSAEVETGNTDSKEADIENVDNADINSEKYNCEAVAAVGGMLNVEHEDGYEFITWRI